MTVTEAGAVKDALAEVVPLGIVVGGALSEAELEVELAAARSRHPAQPAGGGT
jgi:hypothetical protein